MSHNEKRWSVLFHEAFEEEYLALPEIVQDALVAHAKLLEAFGPALGRPDVDTLKGSRHANMKELRFRANKGVWRVAFAFDPKRQAILLVAGDKAGASQKKFYERLIRLADKRFDTWQNNDDKNTERNNRRHAKGAAKKD